MNKPNYYSLESGLIVTAEKGRGVQMNTTLSIKTIKRINTLITKSINNLNILKDQELLLPGFICGLFDPDEYMELDITNRLIQTISMAISSKNASFIYSTVTPRVTLNSKQLNNDFEVNVLPVAFGGTSEALIKVQKTLFPKLIFSLEDVLREQLNVDYKISIVPTFFFAEDVLNTMCMYYEAFDIGTPGYDKQYCKNRLFSHKEFEVLNNKKRRV